MKNPTVFFGAIIVAVIALILAIYYAMPGVYHVLVSNPNTASQPQLKHVVLFAAILVVCIIAALVTRPKSSVR
jgi:archaellum biogenesis protein FlaJ (TadC family)